MILYLSTITAILSHNAQAYVTFILDNHHTYRYPTHSSSIGKPLSDEHRYYHANLLVAPDTNMDMCRNETFDVSDRSYIPHAGNLRRSRNRYRRAQTNDTKGEVEPYQLEAPPLALIVKRGSACTVEEKARRVMDINSRYGLPNGPRIEFMIVMDDNMDDNTIINRHEKSTSNASIDLHIIYVNSEPGTALLGLVEHVYDLFKTECILTSIHDYRLTPDAFLPLKIPNQLPCAFYIYLDDANQYFPYAYILFIFIGIVLGVPFLRLLVLIVVNRGFRWQRDNSERTVGLAWNRPHQRRLERQREEWWGERQEMHFRSVWSGIDNHQLAKLTNDQANALPQIHYNVSDIKEVTWRYDNAERADDTNTGDTQGLAKGKGESQGEGVAKGNVDVDVDKDGHESTKINDGKTGTTSGYLQNAYVSCTSCSICIDDFEHAEKLVLLPQCGHFFHPECIVTWLKEKKATCPLCQTVVDVPDAVPRHFSEHNGVAVASPTGGLPAERFPTGVLDGNYEAIATISVGTICRNDTDADQEAPVSESSAIGGGGGGGGGNDTLNSEESTDTDTRSGSSNNNHNVTVTGNSIESGE